MRLGKRERLALRERTNIGRAVAARVFRAGSNVSIRLSCFITSPVTRPRKDWAWHERRSGVCDFMVLK